MVGAVIILVGGLMFASLGYVWHSIFFMAIGGVIALAGLAMLVVSRVTLGDEYLVQHAPLSPRDNVRIAKAQVRRTHTAPFGTVTQVVVDTTDGVVVLMGLSAYTKEAGVEYAQKIAAWAGVPFDPTDYPDRAEQLRRKRS